MYARDFLYWTGFTSASLCSRNVACSNCMVFQMNQFKIYRLFVHVIAGRLLCLRQNNLYFSCRTSAFVILIFACDFCGCFFSLSLSLSLSFFLSFLTCIVAVQVLVRYEVVEYHHPFIHCNSASQVVLAPLINIALDVTEIRVHTGRDAPTVIT